VRCREFCEDTIHVADADELASRTSATDLRPRHLNQPPGLKHVAFHTSRSPGYLRPFTAGLRTRVMRVTCHGGDSSSVSMATAGGSGAS
jgi:hypothetical protein